MFHTVMGWEHAWPWLLGALVAGYLIGSIPFGVLVARLFGLGDLRHVGSGNIGATNVLRTGNKAAAALTLILDMAKGLVAALSGLWWAGDLAGQAAGAGAVLGHCLPIWLGFRGGKGVATFLGVIIGLSFAAGALTCLSWLVGAALTRISSAAALISTALAPVWMWLLDGPRAVLCAALLAVFVAARHHQNIARLLRGEEPKIGQKS